MSLKTELKGKVWSGRSHRVAVMSRDGVDILVVDFFAGTKGSIEMHLPLEDVRELYTLLDMADGHVNGYGGEE